MIAAKPFIVQAEQGGSLLFVPAVARRLSRRSSRVQRGFATPLLGQPFYGWSPTHTGPFLSALGRFQRPGGAWGGAKIGRDNGRFPPSYYLAIDATSR